jgi:hypothetical protein
MDKADVIRAVSEKTGIDAGTCEKVIKAFEEKAGDVRPCLREIRAAAIMQRATPS